METSYSISYWKPRGAAALQVIRLTAEHLWRFALLWGIQSFIDVFILKLATKSQ
jgi:hypothetical protein